MSSIPIIACRFTSAWPTFPARKKAEREALLAAEEATLTTKKAAPKAGAKKKPAATLAPAPGKGAAHLDFTNNDPLGLRRSDNPEPVAELSATGIDGMLEALELVNQKTDKETMGAKVGLWRGGFMAIGIHGEGDAADDVGGID